MEINWQKYKNELVCGIWENQTGTEYYISENITKEVLVKFYLDQLPTEEEIGAIAVQMSEEIEPNLNAVQQSYYVAGFCDCIKWLRSKVDEV